MKKTITLVFLLGLFLGGISQGETKTFALAFGLWSSPASWDPPGVPDALDNVIISNINKTGTATLLVINPGAEAKSIIIGDDVNDYGIDIVIQSGADLTITDDLALRGTFTEVQIDAGGTLNTGRFLINDIGTYPSTVTVTGSLNVGTKISNAGNIDVTGTLNVGDLITNTGAGEINVKTNGQMNIGPEFISAR